MPSRDDALRSRLNALFLEELEEHVERLERGLEAISAGLPAVEDETVTELFRSAHSLKGASGAVGATSITSLCHQLEDTLVQVRDGVVDVDQGLLDQMVRLVDRIGAAGRDLPGAQGVPKPASGGPAGGAPGGGSAASVSAAGAGSVAPVAPASAAAESTRDGVTVRLTGGRLDTLLGQAGDLITATHRSELLVADCLQTSQQLAAEVDQWRRDRDILNRALGGTSRESVQVREALERIDSRTRRTAAELDRIARTAGSHQALLRGLATNFAESVREARMVPFTEATSGLTRVVRDLSADQGKQARLTIDAARVEVDKQLVSTLHDVLGHAVRNAVAHGIETPEERTAAGKPAVGSVVLRAVLRNNGITVTVSDDGRGVDLARVREKAAAFGLAGSGDLNLNEALFHPGLSTATEVTDVSGRGIGLDAVRAAVESTGGRVSFDSDPGAGSRLEIVVPLTLSTLRVLLVRVDGEVVAMPTGPVRRLVRVVPDQARLEGREVLEVDAALVPVVALTGVLGWGEGAPAGEDRTGMLVDGPDGTVVLVADELVAEREIVLHAAPSRLAGMAMILGTAQMEDGTVSLVLNPGACARAALVGATVATVEEVSDTDREALVLLVEDTVTTREFERSVLVGAGYSVAVAVDGQQAWEMLQARDFDVVVSDVNMPRMDGIALCRAIRDSRRHSSLPVVLVTSLHSDADRRRGLEAGADAYLTKGGFDRADLLAALERVL